jgi:phage shock protein PspC (stress-responsive transcriptional regulator)
VNKVISIEIAKQVFWIEERGFKVLQTYLEKLKLQLADEECGDEIFVDIELRLAELMFELDVRKDRAVTLVQLTAIIKQIGFIDSEEEQEEGEEINTTPKLYLDKQNNIVAGVCAGLSIRFGIPDFILRLSFLGLSFAFGLGVLLYLIFWLSFDKNNTRNSALAAQGKSATAKHIAAGAEVEIKPFLKFQRVIFLPFTFLGVLINVITNSFIFQRGIYIFLIKNIVLLLSTILLITMSVSIVEFNEDQFYPWWLQWILSGAAVYLMVLLSVIFVREHYFSTPYIKVSKVLKRVAIIPVVLISGSVVFLISEMIDEKSNSVTTNYLVNDKTFMLSLNEAESNNSQARKVKFNVKTSQELSDTVKVSVTYASNGRGETALDNNIQAIDYQYSINDNGLVMNRYFELLSNTYNRGQHVYVLIEIPQNITLISSHNLRVKLQGNKVGYELVKFSDSNLIYVTAAQYIHEKNEINQQRITANERSVLKAKFCQQFYINGHRRCLLNLPKRAVESPKLKQEFINETREVDEIRLYLVQNKIIAQAELAQLNIFITFLIKKYPDLAELQTYIQHLMTVKSSLTAEKPAPS